MTSAGCIPLSYLITLLVCGCAGGQSFDDGRDGVGRGAGNGVPPKVVGFALGQQHGCSVHDDGTVRCWGSNSSGQIDPTLVSGFVAEPVRVDGIAHAVQVAVGVNFSCALRDNGRVRCWGFGPGPTNAVGMRTVAENALEVSALGAALCVRLDDGTIQCWPDGETNQPYTVQGIEDPAQIAAHRYGGCAVRSNGTVACWDWGVQFTAEPLQAQPVVHEQGSPLEDVVEIRASEYGDSYFARLVSGQVVAWGQNNLGQLGVGDFDDVETPTAVRGLTAVSAVAIGEGFGCAVRGAQRRVACWGRNPTLNFHVSDPEPRLEANDVPELEGIVELQVGRSAACARNDAGLWCWGRNDGQLSTATTSPVSESPVKVMGLDDALAVNFMVTNSIHSCALSSASDIWCWGLREPIPRVVVGDVQSLASSIPRDTRYCAVL